MRTILHCDLNNFFASVELLSRPELKDKPVAVCGDPKSRHGIILSKNEAAKKFGIKTAETIIFAKHKCPNLILIQSDYSKYSKYSVLVRNIFLDYTEFVEPFGIDEAWLDVTDFTSSYKSGEDIAYEIKERIKKELGLTVSIGVSFNKIFAKLGSDYKKPDAVTVLDESSYKDILYPMDVDSLLFVGSKTKTRLKKMNISTISDLAAVSREEMIFCFGRPGNFLYDIIAGYSDDSVKSYYNTDEVKSVGHGHTFPKDIKNEDEIKRAIWILSEKISGRLRRYNKVCNCVKITLKTPGFICFDRQKKFNISTDVTNDIYKQAVEVFEESFSYPVKIRMLAVTVSGLSDNGTGDQYGLFDKKDEIIKKEKQKNRKYDRSVDLLRNKFGEEILSSASLADIPVLPDVEMEYGEIE